MDKLKNVNVVSFIIGTLYVVILRNLLLYNFS